MKITNCFRVLELRQETAEDGEDYYYLRPSDKFAKDYANETEAIQDVLDRHNEKFPEEYVIVNIKKFE
jgi:hypothetical protein